MNKNYLLLVVCFVVLTPSVATSQPGKWGGAEPAPGFRPPPSPAAQPPQSPQSASSPAKPASCYATRPRGGSAWQITCQYGPPAACEREKADYLRTHASAEAIGCAPAIHCFTYNPGGSTSACYVDSNVCASQRSAMAARGGNIGACVANTTSGSPKVQMASVAPPPPPRAGASPFAQPSTPVAPPPPPGKTAPGTAAAVCDPANVALRPAGAERCFGAIGQACLSQASSGAFQAPPMFWPVAQVASDCRIIEKVSVGSIIHDNCCRLTPDGLYCKRAPGDRIADETSDLPCHREWRKAVYDSLEGRNWPVTFGPYYQNNNGDDMTPASGSKRSVTTFGPSGVQDAPITYGVNEVVATRRLSAPGGTKLEYSDAAFCSSGRFREEGWCDPIGGCSSTKQLCDKLSGCSGGISFPEWDKKKTCGVIDPACAVDKASEASRWNNRVKHWGVCS